MVLGTKQSFSAWVYKGSFLLWTLVRVWSVINNTELMEISLFFSFSLSPSSYFYLTIDCDWFLGVEVTEETTFSPFLILDFLGNLNFLYMPSFNRLQGM
jgi:hypothetical protein